MHRLQILLLVTAAVGLVLCCTGLACGKPSLWQPAAAIFVVALATGLGAVSQLKSYRFTAWILAAVVVAMIYPDRLLEIGPVDLRNPWIILLVVQAVMFGMGTQMSLQDFAGVIKAPWSVLVGIGCQFTIMPCVGFALTKLFHFSPEIAAGIVLIGSCSSGLASNVMVHLAGGNLALSITLTAVATLLAPLMTPLWMKFLAHALVEVHFFDMMMEIIKIVIVPIGAALIHDYLKHASRRGRWIVDGIAALGAIWLLFLSFGGWRWVIQSCFEDWHMAISTAGFLLGAVVVGIVYHWLTMRLHWLDRMIPILSMAGIIYFTAVTSAAGRDDLLKIGGLLFLAAVIHNLLGYSLGYWMTRAVGLDRETARTIAFEVGMQNGGMASGLAGQMHKLGTVGLAAAIFSPWMNVSGSILANFWRKRPVNSSRITRFSP
ncbi:MAG: bile acid:sodium symporter family protein [Pirellulales bacterium]|nr:bile acid:sodium symporter family protein [Pirellulales bacterium]